MTVIKHQDCKYTESSNDDDNRRVKCQCFARVCDTFETEQNEKDETMSYGF